MAADAGDKALGQSGKMRDDVGARPTPSRILLEHAVLMGSLVLDFTALPKAQGTSLVGDPKSVMCNALALHILVSLGIYSFGAMRDRNTPGVWRVIRGCAGLWVGALVFHVVAILYGAPFVDRILETHLWGWLMAVLTVAPTACVVEWNEDTWRRLYARASPETVTELALVIPAHATVLGAWVGAWPIPLDWDRPWQVWPITCTIGAVVGNIIGILVAMAWCCLHVRRRNSEKKDV